MQYDAQLTELKNLLPSVKNILIALPVGSNIDKLSAGLALMLALQKVGKEVTPVLEDTVTVGQAHLFGIDQIKNTLPPSSGGSFVITLEGVAVPDPSSETGWRIPGLTNIDYNTSNSNLDLIFNMTPGQTLNPSRIVPHYQTAGFNLIFVLGAANLNSLGAIYANNQSVFAGAHLVNIDSEANSNFGKTNVVDPTAASISEMVQSILVSLNLSFDQDIATNLLAGIFDGSTNLTSAKVSAGTFMAVAASLQAGGKKPEIREPAPVQSGPAPASTPVASGLDLSALIPQTNETFVNPPVVNSNPISPIPSGSAEERPSMETVVTSESEIEPDWLTPKIFKGNS